MQRKSKIFFFTLLTFLTNTLSAQKMDIVLKGNVHALQPDFTQGNLPVAYSDIKMGKGKGIALSLRYHLAGPFKLGLEGGINRSNDSVSLIKLFRCAKQIIAGNYGIDQYYLAIVPEWRFFKKQWLFVNAGMGYFKDTKSGFKDGTYTFFNCVNNEVEDITSLNSSFARKSNIGFWGGIGACPTIGKHLILLGELRYAPMLTGNFSPDQITYRYHYLYFNVGIGYRI